MEGLLKSLLQWIYGLFIDLINYCANSLLKVMNTDLAFFETSVPVVVTLYKIFVAIGWGLLIGNLAFQALKIMFSGMGFETEPPTTLFLRSAVFGVLLVFSKDVCEIGLSIGKNIINLIGIPTKIKLTVPTETMFGGTSASWLLVIIIGFILGFQMVKLFFEIAERYVVVGVLTLLCPVGLAMGGSKSTKDICNGYIRTYASAIVMMVVNVLFLKLILSALSTMPSDTLILPWCLLVVGIAKVARKADDLLSKIGMSPARTGDPLGNGGGRMFTYMAARTIMNSAMRRGSAPKGNAGNNRGGAGGRNARPSSSARNNTGTNGTTASNTSSNSQYGFGGNTNQNNSQSSSGNFNQTNKTNSSQNGFSSSRFGYTGKNSSDNSVGNFSSQNISNTSGKTGINSSKRTDSSKGSFGYKSRNNTAGRKTGHSSTNKNSVGKTTAKIGRFQKNRFGGINSPNIKHNTNPVNARNKTNASQPARFGNQGSKPVNIDIERTEEESGGKTDEQ